MITKLVAEDTTFLARHIGDEISYSDMFIVAQSSITIEAGHIGRARGQSTQWSNSIKVYDKVIRCQSFSSTGDYVKAATERKGSFRPELNGVRGGNVSGNRVSVSLAT